MIKLRSLEKKHITERVQILRTYEVSHGIFIDQPISLEKSIQWIENLNCTNRKDFVLLLEDTPIGFSGLVDIKQKHGTCDTYIFMDPKIQGKGYGSLLLNLMLAYAKYELNLRKVIAMVSSDNNKVIPFYQKSGFVQEGLLQQHVWRRGQYIDRYIFSAFLNSAPLQSQLLYEYLS